MKKSNLFFRICFVMLTISIVLSGCESDDSPNSDEIPWVMGYCPSFDLSDPNSHADTSVVGIMFSETMDVTSIIVNSTSTTCEGTIQVSETSDFTTCLLMSSEVNLIGSGAGSAVEVSPLGLFSEFIYYVKLTTDARNLAGIAIENGVEYSFRQ